MSLPLGLTETSAIAAELRPRLDNLADQGLEVEAGLHRLEASRRIDAIWLEPRRIGLAALIVVMLSGGLGPGVFVALGLAGGGVMVWRQQRIGRAERAATQELRRFQSQAYAVLNLIERARNGR